MSRAQLDMFGTEEALNHATPQVYSADPERVRIRLNGMLEEVCNAGALGIEQSRRRLFETVVPQMTRWLPDDEAEQFRKKFTAAMR